MYVFEEDVPVIARVGVYAFVPPENSVVLTQLTKSNPDNDNGDQLFSP